MCVYWEFPGGKWLGVHASTAGGTGSISGRRTKIPQAAWYDQQTKKYCVYLSQEMQQCLS